MGLQKEIILDSGITVNYHRIVSVNNIVNHASIIETASYTNQEKRIEEINKKVSHAPINIFIDTEYINIPYNKELNVDTAYEYLKTTEKYKNSTDV